MTTWMPGWGSLEGAAWWSAFYFWLAVATLAVVGFSAAMSHSYGVRKDHLLTLATNQRVLQYQAQAANFHVRLLSATKRHLTDRQKETLIAALSAFPGQPVRFKAVEGDAEAQGYRDDFVAVAASARWSFDPQADVEEGRFEPAPTGVQIMMNEDDAHEGRVPDAVKTLVAALHILGITTSNTIFISRVVPSGMIDVVVGPRV